MLRFSSPLARTPCPLAITLGLVLLLAGCGAAGMDGTSGSSKPAPSDALAALSITTSHLPDGCREGEYPPTQLRTSGAQAPVRWTLAEGLLPEGVSLTAGGILSGRPDDAGIYPFRVIATDGVGTDTRDLLLAVDTFGVRLDGFHFGEVWSASPITLTALCASGSVTFEVLEAPSGGAFDRIDEDEGEAVWMPGAVTGPAADRLRLVDTVSGATTEVVLDVLPHPAAGMVAEFGSSDVWFVDCSRRQGGHGLPRDWDHVLHLVGLRAAAFVPTEADRLADWYMRRKLLAHVNTFFLRNDDGTRGQGLAISFPFEAPSAAYSAPPPGGWASGAPDRFNVISMVHGAQSSIVGMAIVDDATNPLVENDTTCAALGDLGVFANQIAEAYNGTYQNNTLPFEPVRASDEAGLRDLIHGRPVTGRTELIGKVADTFARVLAAVLAHEIGHGLGLQHTSPTQDGSIMNATMAAWRGATYAFLPADQGHLRYALPGPGRMSAGAAKAGAPAYPTAVVACATPIQLSPPAASPAAP